MNASLQPETVLTLEQLARAIDRACGGSRRRDGRPTSARTCEVWCLHGRSGVRLESWRHGGHRVTTWGAYLAFCEALERVHEEARQRRRTAVAALGLRPQQKAARRGERARRRLEEMGAR